MNISQKGLNLIKEFEGCVLHSYRCSANVLTIGYGHTNGVYDGMTITQSQAEAFLKEDVQWAVNAVNENVKVSLNQNQFDALVSFAFNCGIGAFKTSTLLALINQRQFVEAGKQFDLWVHAGGNIVAGLVRRRKAEKELFLTNMNAETNNISNDTYIVVAGDTLSNIASRFNTTVDDLVVLNNIKDPNLIYIGQVLKLKGNVVTNKGNNTYTVKAGDTLNAIANKYGTNADYLARINNIENKNLIYIGQVLKLTENGNIAEKAYTVVPGDTLSGIAQKYGVTVDYLKNKNNIQNVNLIYVGQVIKI